VLAAVTPHDNLPDENPMDVHFARSRDGGRSWSRPRRVNDDPRSTGAWHWFAAIGAAPNGRLDVIWNDTRNTGQDNVSQLFYAWSWDRGQNWSGNVPASPPFDSHLGWPRQNKLGDYYTMVSDASGAAVAYAATFNLEQDVYFVRLFPDCNGNEASDVDDIAAGGSFDCNGNRVPDECEPVGECLAAGTVPSSGAEAALRVEPTDGGRLELSWGESCSATDTDYAIYEGAMADFTSHRPVQCSTDGLTVSSIDPAPGDTYYLVVARNEHHEGSYGKDGLGRERLVGIDRCVPQYLGSCP
jgi:hypothetical protein